MLATAETADRPPRAAPAQACVLGLLVLAWAAAVGAGIWMLWRYANGPGPSGAAAAAWPGGSSLRPDPARPTLLLFLHPLCPCSRASVEELDVLLARAKIRPAVKALFVRPPGLEPGQERQGLWSSAAKIPGVELAVDADGVEARRFRAETSGHVLLFAPDGSLRFSGGITSARGHAGDNAGVSLVLERLIDPTLIPAAAPVFGCLLFDDLCAEKNP